ncbi:MAG: hypothetical protein Q9181_007416 [Wetmoreana brouardii]
MARTSTGRTPRAVKQREGNWGNIGVEGRATGITVPHKPRDEHGMEQLDGLFSSPEKSPPKRNGVLQHSTVMEQDEDETMNIGSSTIPEPTDVIKNHSKKPVLPPPKSRSPIKTSLGSAARRSLGPLSSPSRRAEHETPTHRAMSHPPNRRLDFSISETYSSSKGSATKRKQSAVKGVKVNSTTKRKRGVFDLPPDPEEETLGDETSLVNGGGLTNGYDDDHNIGDGGFDESLQLVNGDDPGQIEDSQVPQDQDTVSPSIEKDTPTAVTKKGGKRGAKSTFQEPAAAQTSNAVSKPARRGRPSKKAKLDVPTEESAEEAAEEPTEEQIEAAAQSSERPSRTMQPPKSKPGRGKGALSLKDPNTKLRPPKAARGASSDPKGPMSPSKTRFISRSVTPGADSDFRTTRAGRNVVKPLAYWRREAAVFSEGRVEEGHLFLPSIKEVIRTEEVPEPRRRKTPGQPRRRRRPQRRPEEDELPEEEDDDEAEYWETEAGVMRASVMLWDPVTGRGDEENVEEADVAYAADAIEMRDIQGADFRFAKTLTLPFFGSGMVDLPPDGTKRVKNSRKMQMVFFVFYGRVTVDLGTPTQRFSIGRGGMWQVPRGNFYSIHNHSSKPARIFFAQGCEVASESAAAGFDESGAA